jgi:branched-chain amino acid transport system substrate-binding protein
LENIGYRISYNYSYEQKNHLVHKVDAIVTQNSPATIAIQPLANRDGILQMAVSASAQKYSTPDDLSFRMTVGSDLETKPIIEYIAKNYKSVAIFYMNNEIGLSQSVSLDKGLKDQSVKIITNESFPVEANDFRSYLTKIKGSKPDVVYVAGLTAHLNNVLKQMKELGINAKFMTFRTGDDVNLIKQSGDLAEGIIFTSNFDPDGTSADILGFVNDFKNKYGDVPDSYAAEGYEGMRFVGKAFAKCGKDYSCIKDYLANTKDYPTVLGNISFDSNGDIYYSYFLKTVKGGKFVKLGE